MASKLTADELNAVAALERLAATWPKSLWLFSASGALHVMKKDAAGSRRILCDGGMDPTADVATIKIENDGGDW